MSSHRTPTGRTEHTPTDSPSAEEVAAQLGADAVLLRRFVNDHPNPTTAIVLSWAAGDAEHYDLVEAYLDGRSNSRERERIDLQDVTDDERILRAFDRGETP